MMDQFLSDVTCRALANQIFGMTTGGGSTSFGIESAWTGNIRWAQNDVTTGGETQQSDLSVVRMIRGASGVAQTNAMDAVRLRACVTRAESLILFRPESPDDYPDPLPTVYPHTRPAIWCDHTIGIDETARVSAAEHALTGAEQAGFLSAGYLEVGAVGRALITTQGLFRYYPYTTAQYSVTVRDPKGQGSGWAGVDWHDWTRIGVEHLAQRALHKCYQSRHPVAIEPGRYTVILEPQAVCDLVAPLVDLALNRGAAEHGVGPFADPDRLGYSRIGQQVMDARLTMRADPMDPECGFLPFDERGEPYRATNWIEHGVLRELAYPRSYSLRQLGHDMALPNSRALRLSGGTATLEEMIANTTRGILVTRLNGVQLVDFRSMLLTGNTRDGLWLIEHGQVTKSLKNFRFTESPLFALNNIEMLGVPQRVFRPEAPAVVPPLMVRDFSFTGLIDAV